MKKTVKNAVTRLPLIGSLLREKNRLSYDFSILQLEKGQLEADVRELKSINDQPRDFLAHQYLRGNGIEIGAAQSPVKLPKGTHVRYVDIFTADELREAWPQDYTKLKIVDVDVVDDGEKLKKFKNNSLDFIIANHFMEHCLDPIGTIINMYSKLRKDGILFFGIPDKRLTFDKERPLTTYKHLLEEHQDTTKKFLWEHTEEFVRLGDKYKGDIKKRTQEIIDSEYRVHYHVWTPKEMYELFTRASEDFALNLEVYSLFKHSNEVIFILKRV